MVAGEFIFDRDFAGNWTAGQVVVCEPKDENKTLVDGVALIDTIDLLNHGHYVDKSMNQSLVDALKHEATLLWQKMCESDISCEQTQEIIDYVVELFLDTN